LNAQVEDPNLWNDQTKAQKLMRERTLLEGAISAYRKMESDLADALGFIELGEEEGDASTVADGEALLTSLVEHAKKQELEKARQVAKDEVRRLICSVRKPSARREDNPSA